MTTVQLVQYLVNPCKLKHYFYMVCLSTWSVLSYLKTDINWSASKSDYSVCAKRPMGQFLCQLQIYYMLTEAVVIAADCLSTARSAASSNDLWQLMMNV